MCPHYLAVAAGLLGTLWFGHLGVACGLAGAVFRHLGIRPDREQMLRCGFHPRARRGAGRHREYDGAGVSGAVVPRSAGNIGSERCVRNSSIRALRGPADRPVAEQLAQDFRLVSVRVRRQLGGCSGIPGHALVESEASGGSLVDGNLRIVSRVSGDFPGASLSVLPGCGPLTGAAQEAARACRCLQLQRDK